MILRQPWQSPVLNISQDAAGRGEARRGCCLGGGHDPGWAALEKYLSLQASGGGEHGGGPREPTEGQQAAKFPPVHSNIVPPDGSCKHELLPVG